MPRLIAMFRLHSCWFESFPFDVQLPRIEPGRIVLPADEPGVASWSGEAGIELPVRHGGLTLGRFVLVPVSPTTGVGFSVTARDEAMSISASVGARIASAVVAESDDSPVRWNAAASISSAVHRTRPQTSDATLAVPGERSIQQRRHSSAVARHLRRSTRGRAGRSMRTSVPALDVRNRHRRARVDRSARPLVKRRPVLLVDRRRDVVQVRRDGPGRRDGGSGLCQSLHAPDCAVCAFEERDTGGLAKLDRDRAGADDTLHRRRGIWAGVRVFPSRGAWAATTRPLRSTT